MQENRFKKYLIGQGYKENTINSRISNCKRVERCEGNLDSHFETDGLESLIESLTYSRKDNTQKHKVPINIDGDIYNESATLKQAVKLYFDFKKQGLTSSGQIINIEEIKNRKQQRQQTHRDVTNLKNPKKKWPQPSEEEILKPAKILTPFIRFLKPEIISKITEDNNKHQDEWSNKFIEYEIDPKIYLWDNSPCAFPGIRRYIGQERTMFKNKNQPNKPFKNCLAIDGNSFPKKLWTTVVDECKGNGQRKGYHLAHLFDHANYTNRYQEETEGWDTKKKLKFFGLFTCPTNTVYSPAIFIKPTDFSPKLRTLLQRKASDLYSDVCQILPHELKVKSCDDPKWDIKNFEWSEPVGDIIYVEEFLKSRREKINKLFEEYHSKWPDVVS